MKKIVLALIILLAVCAEGTASPVRERRNRAQKYDLRFGVISDTHIGGRGLDNGDYPLQHRFEKVLDWYNTQNVKALAIVGDIVDRGLEAHWNIFSDSWESHKGGLQLIAAMGNHETSGAENPEIATERFETATGQKNNAHYVINGYHFIVLCPGAGDFIDQGASGGAIASGRAETPSTRTTVGDLVPPSVKDWVREQVNVAKKTAPGKPIFLFLHWPIRNTFFRTESFSITSFGIDSDTWFFKDDPEVVIFSGHVHNFNNDPRNIWQDGFTSVSTSTLNYLVMESGYLGNSSDGVANSARPKIADTAAGQGLIVSVRGSTVTIENYDFDFSEGPKPVSDVFKIPQTWKFDVSKPGEFPYTQNIREAQKKAPVFDATKPADAFFDWIIFRRIGDTAVEIEFPQPKIPEPNPGLEIVHSYLFEFLNLQTGEIDRSARQYSDFILTPRLQKPEYTQLIGGLKPDTDYELKIFAYSSFQERSTQYLLGSFRTLEESPPEIDL